MKLRQVLLVATAAAAACGFEPAPAPDSAGPGVGLEPIAPIEEVMRYIIDPSADSIWGAVVVDVTAEGTTTTVPSSEEDWIELRRHALIIAEATNLLLMEGRPVAAPGSRSAMPTVDLEPEQIEALLATDRVAWNTFVGGLREAARVALDAIDQRDVDALLTAGDGLDVACENCHIIYWYPGVGFSPPR